MCMVFGIEKLFDGIVYSFLSPYTHLEYLQYQYFQYESEIFGSPNVDVIDYFSSLSF